MTTNDSTAEKRIVERLDFGPKTSKRVAWEQFEFTVVGPRQVEVTNASYGDEKDDHAYVVGVGERGDEPIPAECECPADVHRKPDCKHKVALASVGGTVVLNAAVNFESPDAASSAQSPDDATTAADMLKTDGGTLDVEADRADSTDTCRNGSEGCPGPREKPEDPLPCFDCFESNAGREEHR